MSGKVVHHPSRVVSGISLDESKGKCDKKSYRLIWLDNGLEVLLMNEPVEDGFLAPKQRDDDDEEEEEENDYSGQRAACAVAVGVGSWCNPKDRPGSAHFLEHMLFMGTKKYPKENDYDAYLSKHGGGANARTECEWSVYHLEVSNPGLDGAVDRFAQFFIEPLFRADGVEREVRSIEAEFCETVRTDEARADEIFFRSCSRHHKSDHPFASFQWGNSDSLHAGDHVARDHVQRIFRDHYHASNMKVAILSTKPLDDLQKLIAATFGNVRKSPHKSASTEQDKYIWHRNSWRTRPAALPPPFPLKIKSVVHLIRIVPVGEVLQVRLLWPLESLLSKWRTVPGEVCAHLLGHEGVGSAAAYLRREGLIADLVAGCGEEGYAMSASCGSFFALTIRLTKSGLHKWAFVLDVCFKYLSTCLDEFPPPPPEEEEEEADEVDQTTSTLFLQELKAIAEMQFDYNDEEEAVDIVEDLAIALLPVYAEDQPAEYLLKANQGCPCVDEVAEQRSDVRELLEILRDPRRVACVELMAPAFREEEEEDDDDPMDEDDEDTVTTVERKELATKRPERAPRIEDRFGTEFWDDPVPEDLMKEWIEDGSYSDLAFPGRNPFVATDLSLVTAVDPVLFSDVEATFEKDVVTELLSDLTALDDEDDESRTIPPPPPTLRGGMSSFKKQKKKKTKPDERTARDLWDDDHNDSLVPRPKELDARPLKSGSLWLCSRLPRFDAPLAEIRVRLRHPAFFRSDLALTATDLACVRTSEALAETLYPATSAELRYGIQLHDGTVVVKVGGFSQRLPRLLDLVLKELAAQLHPDRFGKADSSKVDAVASEKYTLALREGWLDCAQHAKDLRLCLLTPDARVPPTAKLAALEKILNGNGPSFAPPSRPNADEEEETSKKRSRKDNDDDDDSSKPITAEVLVSGNADSNYGSDVADVVQRHIGDEDDDEGDRVRVVKLDRGSITRVVQYSVDPECPTTALEVYWQFGDDSLAGRVLMEVIEAVVEEPFYDRLRTQEQLGYSVSCGARWTDGIVGFGARLVSDKAGPRKLESHIDKFLADFRNDLLQNENDFLDHVHSVAQRKLEKDRALSDVADHDWMCLSDRLPFETTTYEALATQFITPRVLRATYDRLFGFSSSDHAPKLVVAVVGQGSSAASSSSSSSSKKKKNKKKRKASSGSSESPTDLPPPDPETTLVNDDPVPSVDLIDAFQNTASSSDPPYFP